MFSCHLLPSACLMSLLDTMQGNEPSHPPLLPGSSQQLSLASTCHPVFPLSKCSPLPPDSKSIAECDFIPPCF